MNLSCVIIEDLKVAADYLIRCCEKSGIAEVKGTFSNTTEALEFLNQHAVDLLFLDVEMPGASGFDLLDQLAYSPKVILTTSKEEYAYNAYQYNVTAFLKKPFTLQQFNEALDKIAGAETNVSAQVASRLNHIFIKSDGKLIRLENKDILYIESYGDYVRFVTADKKHLTNNTIKNLEEKINGEWFMKVHRSYIINLHNIEDIRENSLFIKGVEIPISKAFKQDVMKKLNIL